MIGKSHILTWAHYYLLIKIFDSKAREWYEKECFNQQRQEELFYAAQIEEKV